MKRITWLLCFLLGCVLTLTAQREVTGVVKDVNGEPLIGANILVKGTSIGTATDIDGRYVISVPDGSTTLVFSYTGFSSEEFELGVSNVVDITMQEGLTLSEAVVTALGISREKKSLGYAVSTVSGESVEKRAESDITRLLKGKVAGVNITSTSGVSGTGTNIVIRGYTSLTGSNQPLFIVDGVPFDISTNKDNTTNDFLEGGQATSSRFLDLDPNNIESISVLKGLSATVKYGEQGRNGVVLVTTKNGSYAGAADKLSITVDQSYFQTEIASLPDYQSNYGGGFHQNFGFFFSNWGPHFDRIDFVQHPLDRLSDPTLKAQFPEFAGAQYEYKNYNSTEEFFEKGSIWNSNVSMRGGTEDAQFSATFGYTEDKGFVPGNQLTKTNFGLGGNIKLSNNFTLNSTINFVRTDFATPPISYGDGSGIFAGAALSVFSDVFYVPRSVDLMGLPYIAPADNRPVYYRSGNDILNPRWTLENAKNLSLVDRVYGQSSLSFKPLTWLSINYRIGLDSYTEDQEYIINRIGLSSNDYSTINNGYYRTTSVASRIWDHNAFATVDRSITDDLGISVIAGFNYRQDQFERNGLESTNQLVFGFIEHSNFTVQSAVNSLSGLDIQRKAEQRLVAAYGEVTLDYRDYLYLNVAARNDWSSTVEPENRSLFYPSASLSFIPTELLQSSSVLDYLKLRVGVGTSAGFPAPYSTRSTLSTNARAFVDRAGNVITTNSNATYFEDNGAGSTLGNPQLMPELHREIEVGAEARFFRNRIGIDLTLYQRRTSDLITRAPIDPSTGFTSTFINIGEIENKGIELGLDLTPISGPVTWKLTGNFYAYESLVTDLGGDIDEVTIAGFTNLGNFAIEGEAFGVMKGSGVLRDENGNAIIDGNGWWTPTDETQIIGNPHPDFTTSVTNTLNWKGFSFSFQFDYRKGGDMYSGTARTLLARGLTQDTDFDRTQAFVLDGVKEDGTTNTTMITATNLYFDNYGFGPSEVSVFDATTVRLRDVNLSYQLPSSVLESTPFGEVSITLSGYNLWYDAINFPEHTNVDTDALGFGADTNGLGFEFLNGPSVRRYGASLRVKF